MSKAKRTMVMFLGGWRWKGEIVFQAERCRYSNRLGRHVINASQVESAAGSKRLARDKAEQSAAENAAGGGVN